MNDSSQMDGDVQSSALPVTTIVVDDESHVRTRLVDLLSEFPSLKLVGECGNGIEAVKTISSLQPDLAFLDIQMPNLDGFDVLHSLDPADIPVVVFVTAFDQHAIKAFEVNAVDYVLKPIDEARFSIAVNRSIKRVLDIRNGLDRSFNSHSKFAEQLHRPCRRLLVKTNGKHLVVKTQEIEWIEAADKYVRLHTKTKSYTCRNSMRELESKLDCEEFIRIHRSAIVRIGAIKEIQPYFHGEFKVVIEDGTALPLGRSYKQAFHTRFQL